MSHYRATAYLYTSATLECEMSHVTRVTQTCRTRERVLSRTDESCRVTGHQLNVEPLNVTIQSHM